MAVMDAVSKVTPLASSQINTTGTLTIELIEADETPAVIIIRWPLKASVLHLDWLRTQTGDSASTAAHLCAPAARRCDLRWPAVQGSTA
jgi:hypothetical protein